MTHVLGVLGVIVGASLLAIAVWVRSGRGGARDWMAGRDSNLGSVLLTLPGGALMLLGLGLIPFTATGGSLATVALLCLLLGVPLVLADVVLPRVPLWFVPGWAREQVAYRRRNDRAARRSRTGRSK